MVPQGQYYRFASCRNGALSAYTLIHIVLPLPLPYLVLNAGY